MEQFGIKQGGVDVRGRVLSGWAIKWGAPIETPSGLTIVTKGAFRKTIAERGNRVRVLAHHDTTRPIGIPRVLEERPQGLWIEANIANTRDGDDVLELARVGALDGWSIGFDPIKVVHNVRAENLQQYGATTEALAQAVEEPAARWRVIREGRLLEVSAVAFPAQDVARMASDEERERRIAASLKYMNALAVKLGIDPEARVRDARIEAAQSALRWR